MPVIDDEYATTAELYDFVIPYRDRQDVAFFVEAARQSGGPVLEVGCGTGRVLIPTAIAGLSITGLDLSPHMLAVCQARLEQQPEAVRQRARLVQADMRQFDLGQRFRLVTLPFRPFQHLVSVEDQLACLQTLHRHLEPGGLLILDLFNPSLPALAADNLGQEQGDEPEFTMPDGRRVLRRFQTLRRDLFSQVNDVELIYHITYPDGRTERQVHAFPMRFLFRYEAEHLLARAGFAVQALYADYDKSSFGSKYPGELIFVARKAG